jgi:hypothetical protein
MQANAKLRRDFEEALRTLGRIANHPPDDDREVAETLLDLTQMGLDIAGIIEPTPIADGINTGISAARGKFVDAGISLVALIPYLGDLAKLGKLGKYPQQLDRAIKLALKSERFMKLLRPVLKKLRQVLGRIPLEKLPDSLRRPLENLKRQLDNFFEKVDAPRGIPNAKRLSKAEQATAERLQQKLGVKLEESPHAGAEYVDDLGRTYDAVGSPEASKFWNKKEFLKSIDRHLMKSNDFTVIDLTGFTPEQVVAVRAHLDSLPSTQQAKIIRIGF